MPELPEVETICRNLRPHLAGSVICGAQVHWARSLAEPDLPQFVDIISNQRITGVERRGKFILMPLECGVMLTHLRMSGDLRVEDAGAEVLPHDRVIITLSGDRRLAFNDARKFGRMWWVEQAEAVLGSLGPEPFDPELTPEVFHHRLLGKKRLLKPLLLDQTFLAGLGNIYTDESLHLAKLHPESPSDCLSLVQAEMLLGAIRAVLQEGIQRNGASIDWVYRGGDFQNHFRVYQRTGQPCPECGTNIVRMVIGQRGTHFCPRCQTRLARE